MILLIIFCALLLLVGWFLFAPLQLRIDTRNQAYLIRWRSIGRVQLLPITDDIVIQLRIFFWRKNFHPLEYRPKKKEKKPEKAKKKEKKRKWDFHKYKRKGLRVLKSFRIRAFRLNLDTDDYVQNSYLYPLFHLLNGKNRQLTVNYQGETELLLVVENRLYKLLLAFLF